MQSKILKFNLIGVLLMIILGSCSSQKEKKVKPEILDQYFFEYTSLTEPENILIRNEDTWIRLQKRMFQNQNPPPKLEPIDFLKENVVVIAFGQKRTGGTQYTGRYYSQIGDVLRLTLAMKADANGMETMALTQPVLMCKIPLTSAKKVEYYIQSK